MHEQPRAPETNQLIPSRKQQSWGALISIIVIVLMIVVGALYVGSERVAQNVQHPSDTDTDAATGTTTANL